MFGRKKESKPKEWPGGNMETGEGFASMRWNHDTVRVLSLDNEWIYADLEAHIAAGWQVITTYVYGTNGYGGNPSYRMILKKPQ